MVLRQEYVRRVVMAACCLDFLFIIVLSDYVFAETILFKTGKTIKVSSFRLDGEYLIVSKNSGLRVRYLLSDIESIVDENVGLDAGGSDAFSQAFSTPFTAYQDSPLTQSEFPPPMSREVMYRSFERDLDPSQPVNVVQEFKRAEDMIEDVHEDFDEHFPNR